MRGARLGNDPLTVERDADKLRAVLPSALAAGEEAAVTLVYGGQPYVAESPPREGGFV